MSDGEIAAKILEIFPMRPYDIINRFQLKNPIYERTASYGHFGRDSYEEEVEVFYQDNDTYTRIVDGKEKTFKKVTFFGWERLDYVEKIKEKFGL